MLTVERVEVDLESLSGPIDLPALFGNHAPVELEIGCGKGGFLLQQARAHPDRNYLGLEWAAKYARFAADRMARWGLSNVRIARTDARHFVIHRLPPACLNALHVYHPDPWPKKRHHKRRLVTPEFVAAAARALRPGARWIIQTDHAEYFESIRVRLAARPELIGIPPAAPLLVGDGEHTGTNYEIKFLREGRPIHRLSVRRREHD